MDNSLPLTPETLPTRPDSLLALLDRLGIVYRLHRHAPIFTVAEGEPLKKQIPGIHCRNLFLKDKKSRMFLVVAANETAVDLKKLEHILGCARLSFGSAERLGRYLGIYPGAVCPFAVINDREHKVEVLLDSFMMGADIVCYHPLDNAATIALSPADLLKFFAHTGHKPQVLNFGA